jgi:membrane-associated phospholipid phosphatase
MGWRKLGWLSVAIAAEVAFGCVYVGVHYGTDVLAGAALGAASGWVAWLLLGRRPLAGVVVRTDEVLRKVHLRRRPAVSVDTA